MRILKVDNISKSIVLFVSIIKIVRRKFKLVTMYKRDFLTI